jgi:uncharacterized RDD family membrane protein YckC
MSPAGFWRRLAAYLLDVVPITFLVALPFYLWFGFDQTLQAYQADSGDHEARWQFLRERNRIRDVAFLVWIVYSTVLEASPLQGTLGKRAFALRVVGPDGRRLTLRRSLGRNLGKLLSYFTLGLGFLAMLWSKRWRAWHDTIARTDVVRAAPAPRPTAGVEQGEAGPCVLRSERAALP